jgi:hypothetical protein
MMSWNSCSNGQRLTKIYSTSSPVCQNGADKRLVEVLEEEFDFKDMKSEKMDINLHDGRVATIPVINVAPQI